MSTLHVLSDVNRGTKTDKQRAKGSRRRSRWIAQLRLSIPSRVEVVVLSVVEEGAVAAGEE
jgi:hypothetical protein